MRTLRSPAWRSIILGRRRRPSQENAMDEQAAHADRKDSWDSGDGYETYVGRWSSLIAREFLGWLAVPPGRRWLDTGCGTGAHAESILALAAPGEVVGTDPSPAYVAVARDQVIRGLGSRSETRKPCKHPRWPSTRWSLDSPQLRAGTRQSAIRDGARGAPGRRSRRLRLGLRRGHADDAPLLGRGGRPRPEGKRDGRRTTLYAVQPGTTERPLPDSWVKEGRGACYRRTDRLPRLRRLLVALPGRPGPRAGLRDVAERGAAGGSSRARSDQPAH